MPCRHRLRQATEEASVWESPQIFWDEPPTQGLTVNQYYAADFVPNEEVVNEPECDCDVCRWATAELNRLERRENG
jgi:hypothetical protein